MSIEHAISLHRARSSLAALADRARTVAGTDHYERMLIDLDRMNGDAGPAISRLPDEMSQSALFQDATDSIADLATYGADSLLIELLLADLRDTFTMDGA
ncbi:MAG: hypothetical protein ACXVHX_02295 [Solirubrobacteraceae bacterium]